MSRADSVDELEAGVRAGDRGALARAITLVESARLEDRKHAVALLERLAPHTGGSRRVGISGVPGVGKSTFIESLGVQLVEAGKKVAVLAVDPSSTRSGGSILGDKTRMAQLSRLEAAFIRPSPTAGALGGVSNRTRECISLCEAAGYDVVLVETVGVGQSETEVDDMVDTFVVLMLPGAGDELQGIKRGILELADVLVINKADGNRKESAAHAKADYGRAMQLMPRKFESWRVPVQTCSSTEGTGVGEVWDAVEKHRAALESSGELEGQRAAQRTRWMWRILEREAVDRMRAAADERADLAAIEAQLQAGSQTPEAAAMRVLEAIDGAK